MAAVLAAGAMVAFVGLRRTGESRQEPIGSPYTPSSAAVIGTTGRPQLVEFFHQA